MQFVSEINPAYPLDPSCPLVSPRRKQMNRDRSLQEKYVEFMLPPVVPDLKCRVSGKLLFLWNVKCIYAYWLVSSKWLTTLFVDCQIYTHSLFILPNLYVLLQSYSYFLSYYWANDYNTREALRIKKVHSR